MRASEQTEVAATDPFDALLGYHLRRLSVLVMADLTASLAPLGLKPADASILLALNSDSVLTQSDIGRRLGIQRANMAPLMAGLMHNGLVEKQAVDRRSYAVRLSRAGRAVHRQVRGLMAAHEARMFASLTPAARQRLVKQLKALWQMIQQEDSGKTTVS
jgi:DNA-binding MarR family transcriptional regulator